MGSNQGAILGYNSISDYDTADNTATGNNEIVGESTTDDISSSYIPNSYEASFDGVSDSNNYKVSTASKLAIYKMSTQDTDDKYYNFINSHIAFYTIPGTGATTDKIEYAGRLAMDSDNIALGKGTLQSMSAGNIGENTAIGHFALLNNSVGIRNTAVGKKALASNVDGDYNTALGYASLLNLTKANDGSEDSSATFENTSVGALSLEKLILGSQNTAVGSQALRRSQYGVFNTAVGRSALINLGYNTGVAHQQNTAIGSYACSNLYDGDNNICIGYRAGNSVLNDLSNQDSNGLYIGGDDSEYPLISGHTAKEDDDSGNITNDKELIVSARKVEFRPYDGDEDLQSFEVYSNLGTDGYTNVGSLTSYSVFNLEKNSNSGTTTSLAFDANTFGSDTTTTAGIYAFDKQNAAFNYDGISSINNYDNISMNDNLLFDFSDVSSSSVGIETLSNYNLVLNDKLTIQNNDETPALTMDSSGFSLVTSSNNEYLYLDSNGFTTGNNNAAITVDTTNGGTIALHSTSNNTSITVSRDITLSTINTINLGDSGNVKVSQNKLYINSGDSDMYIEGSSIKNYVENIARSVNNNQSDERLKNISGDSTAGLKEINALEVKNYTYKADKEKTPHVGVIAQQLQKIFPNSVFEGDDGYLRIRTEEIFYAMVNSIKELCTKIQDLTAKITGLDKRITELEEQNKLLTEQNEAFEKRLEKLEKKAAK
ncbi:MAG: tail fiber domain-containing protein [Candidatus Gastranaerophilales bacterium]|nr:tail fiber domain-containing protein [Candidatus Gastranaerophilales bacterium]